MADDPRAARTLDEAALNADGQTYNGARALAWLSEALNPGKGLSEADVQQMWEDAKRKRDAQRG